MKNIKVDSKINANGTSWHFIAITVPAKRFAKFMGNDSSSDDYKISKQWVCEFEGLVFTVYDWKETSLYSENLPSPKDFWGTDQRVTLHIGSKTGPAVEKAFAEKLLNEFEKSQRGENESK